MNLKIYNKTPEPNPKFTQRMTFPEYLGEYSGKTIEIVYYDGVAEVPSQLGNYMVQTGRASAVPYRLLTPARTGLILPNRN